LDRINTASNSEREVMDIPANVQNYYDAQWWIFVHWGIPVGFILVVVWGIVIWLQDKYDDD
jgi:hypothetical protein